MRILYILSGTEANGGATKSFLAMADSVARAGHEVAIVVPDEKGITPVLRDRGWEVVVVPYLFCTLPYISWSLRDIVRFVPRLVWSRILNAKARKVVDEFASHWHPDIVHDNTSVTDLGHYAAKKVSVPHVVHVREYGWKDFRRVIPGLKKRLSASNAFMVGITSELAAFRGKGLKNDHVRVIYNGVISQQQEEYDAEKSPYFLYAGRIQNNKGVDDLIEAYVDYATSEKGAQREPLALKIAGAFNSEELVAELKSKISRAGLNDYVQWLGEINDVKSLYSKTAATVIPSKSEGFGRVMPEAMAAGSLCVVRKAGGLNEQLRNGKSAVGRDIAFGFDTVEDLSKILSEISDAYRGGTAFTSNGDCYRMIMDSRDVVSNLYSYEANARNILDFYSFILQQNKN